MLSLPQGISSRDIRQWLQEGWYFVEYKNGEKAVACLLGVTEDGTRINSLTTDGMKVTSNPRQVYPHWPTCGALNVPVMRCAVYLERCPRRQWKRTYTSRCLKVIVPGALDLYGGGFISSPNPSISANMNYIVTEAFNPQYFSYREAKRLFNLQESHRRVGSVALNQNVIVVWRGDQLPFVYYRARLIGKICDDQLITHNEVLARHIIGAFNGDVRLY